jgi:hypothetical protein
MPVFNVKAKNVKHDACKIRATEDDDDQGEDLIGFYNFHSFHDWIMTFNSLIDFLFDFLFEIFAYNLFYLFNVQEIG